MRNRGRGLPYGTLFIVAFALAAPARAADELQLPPVQIESAGGATNWNSTIMSLERVGFTDGFTLEGSQGTRRLFLPLPPGVPVSRAQLAFDIEFGELLIPESSLQVRVNDTIRTAARRGASGTTRRVEIPLTALDLEKNFVELEVDYSLFVHPDVCLSQKLVGAYAHLTPGSGLQVVARDRLPRTVQAALSLLPREVIVAAPLSRLDADQFQALFHLATALFRLGHKVAYDDLPASGTTRAHIVMAPASQYLSGGAPLAGPANLRLLQSRDGAFILVDATRPLAATAMLRKPWREAAGGAEIDVADVGAWPQLREAEDIIRLKRLGFDDSERLFSFSSQWDIPLPFGPMGISQRPARASLEIYGPRVAEIRGPTFISVFFNDRLVHSAALKEAGKGELVEFELPRIQLRARNNLKIVAQRDQLADDCKVAQAPYPLSLSPDSVIETVPLNETPATFAELVPHQQRLEVYVSSDALKSVAQIIPMLVSLGEQFWPDIAPPRLKLYEPGAALQPAGPFFVIGDPQWAPRAWVRFDEGRVRLRSNATGEPLMLLDFASDASTTVLQMVEAGGFGGAWLKTTAGYAGGPARRALFEDENLAFLSPAGGQLALRLGETRDYRVDYPEAKGWFEESGALRPALFVMAWAVIIAGLVYLYRRTRRAQG
ncbi:MAG: cellulose biosynthesis cyclic di-GMP-binding regulatory protein BcsB [Gammaproteobacteria bacterium]